MRSDVGCRYICLVCVPLVVEPNADDIRYVWKGAQQLGDLVFPACAFETTLDVALEDLDFHAGKIAGCLALKVPVKGSPLLVNKSYKSLKGHGRCFVALCFCFGKRKGYRAKFSKRVVQMGSDEQVAGFRRHGDARGSTYMGQYCGTTGCSWLLSSSTRHRRQK